VLDVFSASLEPFLTVLAGFNQVIEYRDGFFIHVGHFSIPCDRWKMQGILQCACQFLI
jgi:hypothetical protein